MLQRVSLDDLSLYERVSAILMVSTLLEHFPRKRVELIFRSLAAGEPLLLTISGQKTLPMPGSSLLRNERTYAVSTALALNMKLGEESAERVIACLGQAREIGRLFLGEQLAELVPPGTFLREEAEAATRT